MALKPKSRLGMKSKYSSSGSYTFKKRNTDKPIIFPTQSKNSTRRKSSSVPKIKFDLNMGNLKPILFVVIAIAVILFVGYFAFSRQALAVMVNDEAVGYIKDMGTTEDELNSLIVAKLKEDVGNNIELNETVTLKKVNSMFKHVSNNAEDVVANACKAVTYKQEGCMIVVDGTPACIVANEETATSILQQVLDSYTPPNGTTDPEFVSKITKEATFVDSTKVLDVDSAVKLLSQTKEEEKVYTVVSGDTFASIAANAGMTESELLKANPSISSETKNNLSVGQQLNIVMTVPTLTIRTYKIETKKVSIPYDTIEEDDDSLSSGERQEVQAGVNGEKEVSEKVAYINGVAQGAATSSEKVTKQPVDRIVKVGTYVEEDYDSSYDDSYDDSYDESDDSYDDSEE